MSVIFIDGSYFVFYRFFATSQWWKLKNPDVAHDNLSENNEFISHFKDLFKRKLLEIPKRLKIKSPYVFVVALDCPRQKIWRNELFSEYKSSRKNDNEIGKIFKIVMEEQLFCQAGVKHMISMNSLEADDCIALSVKYVTKKYPNKEVYVITNDHDYLQLKSEHVHLLNLKFQVVGDSKTTGNPQKDLFLKAVCGDKSDNIPGIFCKLKVGKKKAENYFENECEFKDLCNRDDPETYEKYRKNMRLISFDEIPESLVTEFLNKHKELLDEL